MQTPLTAQERKIALDQAVTILEAYLPAFTQQFAVDASYENFYIPMPNRSWTSGFRTGNYWLTYEQTGREDFRDAALVQVDDFGRRIDAKIEVDHHDMGFLYTPSCVAAHKLTGSEEGRRAAILAADQLITRFHEKGEFIQAWGAMGAADNYRLIIDCLMNLPLLYWASETTGDPKYADIARRHTRTSLQNLVRPDDSTYHTFFFDIQTGAPLRGVTHQGYRDGSAWARGQAWGIYGVALSYRYTKDPDCLSLFERIATFFLNHLPDDGVPFWDLDFTTGDEPRDSSAAAIAACGMLEMLPHLPEDRAAFYRDAAERIAGALFRDYAVSDPSFSNGLILHGVYGKSSPYNTVRDNGVDECNTWGDYFYHEMLTHLDRDWNPYW